MSVFPFEAESQSLSVIEHMLASGEILPTQLPSRSSWSPEKKLAAAVFVSGLVEIRNYAHVPSRRKSVEQELQWVFSDDDSWPYSFLRLCELLHLDPQYVRNMVKGWLARPASERRRICSAHRHAA
ncbi:MAG: hypothetical protein N3C12_10230 [Candidatus Binatia bacterium]|nr:hypothetical protein [Candidatus Binatia bacterium]